MKAILVMEMPENCYNCDLCYCHTLCVPVKDDKGFPFGKISREVPGIGKPNWCQLKSIPERKEENDYHNSYEKGLVDGFNACIDAIEGSK